LKDQSAVQNAEKVLREFKPVDYDLSKWNGVVDAFEGKAVAAAKETLAKISKEEGSLKETLSNIQEARPFEDLTVSLGCRNGEHPRIRSWRRARGSILMYRSTRSERPGPKSPKPPRPCLKRESGPYQDTE
jgi:hypothetical protein